MSKRLFALVALLLSLSVPAQAAQSETFLCQVFASMRVELASPTTGVLESIAVERGDRVRVGQEIARLRSEIEEAELALAELKSRATANVDAKTASLAFSERRLARNADLVQRRMVAENDVDQMRTERDLARLELEAARQELLVAAADLNRVRAALALRQVRSPIDGIVTARNSAPGELVGNQPVAVIERTDPLYAEAALPVRLFGELSAGMSVHLQFETQAASPLDATLTLVDTFVEPTSDTFVVRATIPNKDNRIPAGIKCHMTLP